MQSVGRLFLSAICVFASAQVVAAQEAINYGSVSGRVSDAHGAVIPGAAASARHLDTGVAREAVTDHDGRFRFPYLRVGAYEVIVRLSGFAEFAQRLTVTAGSAFELPVRLSVGGLSTAVTVTADHPVLEAARSQIAGTVSQAEVAYLPLNGRNFLDVALLVPGVSPTNAGSTQVFAETSAVPGQGLSIGSQRNFSNNFLVDGLSANDDASGLSGIPYSVGAVDQIQVVTSGGQAELGRALAGYVSVVTRSGTNDRHGELYAYFRDRRLNAANALSGTRLPMRQKQYGASLGGPVFRNRTFYFTNVEQRRLDQTGLTTISDEHVATINTRLRASGYPGALVATGVYPNPIDTTHFLAKIDHQLDGGAHVSFRYSLYDAASQHSRGAGALNAPSASAGLDNRDQTIALANTMTLSSRTVSETRVQFAQGQLAAPPADPLGPAVSIAGVASFGTLSGSPQGRVNKMVQVVNNLSHQAGAHALRAGVDFIYNDTAVTFPRAARGAYTFSSIASFLSGTYNQSGFTQTFGETVVAQTNPNVGMYVQDEWKVGRDVTVNAGLRYELQFLETINTDTDNVSPRLGLAWVPSESRRTVIRGGAGLYFDRVPLRALANALLSAGNTTDLRQLRQMSVSLSPAQAGAPVFPGVLSSAVPSQTQVNLTTMDRNIQNAHSRQASVEVERRIGADGLFSAGYQYLRGANLIMQINQNVPMCAAVGGNNGCRPNPAYANNNQYSSAGDSNYHGLHLSFMHRAAAWGHYRVSYTYSKSMNNLGEHFFSAPIDPTDLSKDWGRSDDDQRHRLVVSGATHLPLGFDLSGALQAYSALPFNVTSGLTTIQGTTARPVVNGAFIERNTGVGSDFFTLSARLSRPFRIAPVEAEAIAEAFNLTNRRNVLTRNINFGPGAYPDQPLSSFGRVTAVGDPRSVQVGLRVRF